MALAEQRIDVQARIAEQQRAVGNRIAISVVEQAGRKNFAGNRRAFEHLADLERAIQVAAQIGCEVGAKSLHLGSVERGRRDCQSVLASTDQVAGAGCRFEFRDDFVAELFARNAFEVGVVIGARARHVDALECVDSLRRDLRDRTAHAVGADRQRRAKLVDPGSILAANSQHGAVFDDQIGKPQALAKRDALETAGRVDHRGIHQGAAEAQSAIVGAVAREFAAVVEVGTESAHPLEADAARALEHFEHAHSPEHLGAAAKHDMRRETVGRERVLVDQQNAALVAREQNRGSTAGDACADNYRVKMFSTART